MWAKGQHVPGLKSSVNTSDKALSLGKELEKEISKIITQNNMFVLYYNFINFFFLFKK